MYTAHFFDFDVIIDIDNKPWIVDKENPNIPLLKLSKSDFNLIKSGIYKNQGNKINFNGSTFWLSNSLINKLKKKAKNSNINLSNLAISMQEFLNPDLIENIKYRIKLENLSHLKNKTDDIYLICSKNSKRNYNKLIAKLNEELKKEGLHIKTFYQISETFYNRNEDKLNYDKVKLLIQHLLGFKTDGDKFIDEEITAYKELNFYDDDIESIKTASDINKIIDRLILNSEDIVKEKIENAIQITPKLIINRVNVNNHNRFTKNEIKIVTSKIIKKLESFTSR